MCVGMCACIHAVTACVPVCVPACVCLRVSVCPRARAYVGICPLASLSVYISSSHDLPFFSLSLSIEQYINEG